MNAQTLRHRVDGLLRDHEHATKTVEAERVALAAATQYQEDAEQVQGILQHVAQEIQLSAHNRIASVVTRCLSSVYGERAYEFKVRFVKKRGKTEAELVFLRDGHELTPRDDSSGAMTGLAAFALRISSIMLARPKLRRVVFLDEPFVNVEADAMPLLGELLETLATELSMQFVLTTHSTALQVGKVVRIGQ